MADEALTYLAYHLPLTVVRVRGQKTTKNILGAQGSQTTAQAEFALEPRADPDEYYEVDFSERSLQKSVIEFELTEDGRLVSTEAKAIGALGKIVKSVFGFVTSAIAVVAGGMRGGYSRMDAEGLPEDLGTEDLMEMMLLGGDPGPDAEKKKQEDILNAYESSHPEMANHRKATSEAISKLEERIVNIGRALAGDEPKKTDEDGVVLKDQQGKELPLFKASDDLNKMLAAAIAALKVLRVEAAKLNAHFKAWKVKTEASRKQTFDFTMELTELPTGDVKKKIDSALESAKTATDRDKAITDTLPDPYREVFESSRAIVVIEDNTAKVDGGVTTLTTGGKYRGIVYRQARPVTLELWLESKGDLTLAKRDIIYVVDNKSRRGFVQFGKTKWSERSAKATMGASGSIKTLGNTTESDAAAAADTLQQLPAEVLARLKQANEIIDQGQLLALQGVQQRIAELEHRKKLIDADIAESGALATMHDVEEKLRLEAEIDRLKANQSIGQLKTSMALEAETAGVRHEIELLKVRVELSQQELARLKLEAEMAELSKP